MLEGPVTKRCFVAAQSTDGLSWTEAPLKKLGSCLTVCWHVYVVLNDNDSNQDELVAVAPLLPEERRGLLWAAASAICSVLQLIFALTIPFPSVGVVGGATLLLTALLAREVWLRRLDYLIYAVLAPVPVVVIEYVMYLLLAEALDQDQYVLASEDDLEQSVEANLSDRVSAVAGVLIDAVQV